MALQLLTQLQRRRRQLDTLRQMLRDVDQLIGLVDTLASERELTTDEQREADSLTVRRDRIAKSIEEAELHAQPGGVRRA